MIPLSLAERRALAARLTSETPPAIDELARSLGRNVTVLRETETSWSFVIPEPMPARGEPLPEPTDDRQRLDNAVLELLMEDETLAVRAVRQPAVLGTALSGRLPEDFLFVVGPEDRIEIHRERADELAVAIPLPTRRFRLGADHELSDEMLDLVAGGGKYPCNTDDSRFAADNYSRPVDGGKNDP